MLIPNPATWNHLTWIGNDLPQMTVFRAICKFPFFEKTYSLWVPFRWISCSYLHPISSKLSIHVCLAFLRDIRALHYSCSFAVALHKLRYIFLFFVIPIYCGVKIFQRLSTPASNAFHSSPLGIDVSLPQSNINPAVAAIAINAHCGKRQQCFSLILNPRGNCPLVEPLNTTYYNCLAADGGRSPFVWSTAECLCEEFLLAIRHIVHKLCM